MTGALFSLMDLRSISMMYQHNVVLSVYGVEKPIFRTSEPVDFYILWGFVWKFTNPDVRNFQNLFRIPVFKSSRKHLFLKTNIKK